MAEMVKTLDLNNSFYGWTDFKTKKYLEEHLWRALL